MVVRGPECLPVLVVTSGYYQLDTIQLWNPFWLQHFEILDPKAKFKSEIFKIENNKTVGVKVAKMNSLKNLIFKTFKSQPEEISRELENFFKKFFQWTSLRNFSSEKDKYF